MITAYVMIAMYNHDTPLVSFQQMPRQSVQEVQCLGILVFESLVGVVSVRSNSLNNVTTYDNKFWTSYIWRFFYAIPAPVVLQRIEERFVTDWVFGITMQIRDMQYAELH